MIYQILPEFVEEISKEIDDGYLYISLPYNAVIHKCACGCGEIISTPLDRKHGWVMQYDGEAVSLSPSIGNGAYKCHSHYFIRENSIVWLDEMNDHVTKWRKKKNFSLKKLFRRICK